MRDLIGALREQVPGALAEGRAEDVPLPEWWPSERIDMLPRVVQLSGEAMDVNSAEDLEVLGGSSYDEIGRVRRRTVAGAWTEVDESESAPEPPPGWSERGVEMLAWYSSFRYCAYAWGIFVRSSGVETLAQPIVAAGADPDEAFRLAWAFLYEHELTHFKADLLVTGAEFASRTPLFLPGRQHQLRSPELSEFEEALATHVARRSLPSHLRTALDDWLNRCPPGYRDWKGARGKDSWNTVVGNATQGGSLPVFWTPPASATPPFVEDVPVFLVLDSPVDPHRTGAFVGPIPHLVETSPFQRDLRSLAKGAPTVMRAWEKRKAMLAAGSLAGGTHLEMIDRRKGHYSVRIDGNRRAGLKRLQHSGEWQAIAADVHDRLYARLSRME